MITLIQMMYIRYISTKNELSIDITCVTVTLPITLLSKAVLVGVFAVGAVTTLADVFGRRPSLSLFSLLSLSLSEQFY